MLSRGQRFLGPAVVFALLFGLAASSGAGRRQIGVTLDRSEVDTYDFVEVTLRIEPPMRGNPFEQVDLTGSFRRRGTDAAGRTVVGFCDADNGSVFRIRFMPQSPGFYEYLLLYQEDDGFREEFKGGFRARDGGRPGVVRVDADHPFHFVWSGSGKRYFYSGTTAYHLLSWTHDNEMLACIDRIAATGCNRIRLLNYGRASDNEWGEGMVQSDDFVWTLSPWPARHPSRQLNQGSPEFDHTRFNLAHWRKAEKALSRMRDRDVIGSLILLMDRGRQDAPPAGSELEKRYYRYAVARYGAFSNVMWDLGNEHDEYRTPEWAAEMGSLIKQLDSAGHLITAHGRRDFLYDREDWADFAIHQRWADGQNEFMLAQRAEAIEKGRIIPQVNEEYGYEKHKGSGQEEVRRRAWEIVMAGGYQTTGEWKGWQHGKAATGSEILNWTGIMRRLFEEDLPWWLMTPANQLLKGGSACVLAQEGVCYAVYLPAAEPVTLNLAAGVVYSAAWVDPRRGRQQSIAGDISGGVWLSPQPPGSGDWVLLVKAR